jgi:hypothetical protein
MDSEVLMADFEIMSNGSNPSDATAESDWRVEGGQDRIGNWKPDRNGAGFRLRATACSQRRADQ